MSILGIIVPSLIMAFLFFNTYIKYDKYRHYNAIKKAGLIWIFSSLPWVLGLLFSKPDINSSQWIISQFAIEFINTFRYGEMFIYAAAFLSPVVYKAVEAVQEVQYSRQGEEKKWSDYKSQLRGIGSVVVLSFLILILTAFSFATAKGGAIGDSYFLIFFGGHPIAVYIISLALWYAVVLADAREETVDTGGTGSSSQNLSTTLKKTMGIESSNE